MRIIIQPAPLEARSQVAPHTRQPSQLQAHWQVVVRADGRARLQCQWVVMPIAELSHGRRPYLAA
jgi:hypothetical protein